MKLLTWLTANRDYGERVLNEGDKVDVYGVSSIIVCNDGGTVLFVKDVAEFSIEEEEA